MIVDAGSVVVVPFPFAEVARSKGRPALVLSQASHNRDVGLTILAMITRAHRTRWALDVAVTDLTAAGLREPCFVRPRVASVPNELIERVIGELSEADLVAVRKALERLFGWRA